MRLENKTIFCLGVTDYGSDVPVGKDHLMEQFAVYNNVVIFNLSGTRMPSLTRSYDIRKIFRKIISWLTPPRIINKIIVVNPIKFPFVNSRMFNYINNMILYCYLVFFKWRLKTNKPIIISLSSFYLYAIQKIKYEKLIYYISDDYGMFTGNDKQVFYQYERKFMKYADGAIAVSDMLYNSKKQFNSNTIKIYNATNPEKFCIENAMMPKDLENIKGKIVGCIGKIDDWYDLEFIDKIATLNLEINFIFIGPIVRSIINIKSINMIFLGQKDYKYIPNYINSFDVCIIPYKDIERIRTVDMPLKLLDYLATGKPIIAKNINHIPKYKNLYKICNNIKDFNSALLYYLDNPNDYKDERIKVAIENSWQERSNMLGDWIIKL